MTVREHTRAGAVATTLVATAATIFATTGPATAAEPAPGDPYIPPLASDGFGPPGNFGPYTDSVATVVVPDPNGNPVIVTNPVWTVHTIVTGSDTPDGPVSVVADTTQNVTQGQDVVTEIPAPGPPAGVAPLTYINTGWTGCRDEDSTFDASVDVWFGTYTFYQYHVHLHWCGDGNGGVTKPSHYDWVSNTDFTTHVGGIIADNGGVYYNAWGNYEGRSWPKSGYNEYMQREISSGYAGVNVSTYPYARIIGFADGVAYSDSGVG